MINYKIDTVAQLPDMTIDGVEITTRREREAAAAMIERMRRDIDRQVEDAIMGRSVTHLVALPPPPK